jgi:uncharacterized OsmC-like protein
MNSTTFLARQAPLKELYRKDAQSALLTLTAKGALDTLNVTCKVETGRGLATAGMHQRTGGSGLELCSGDMLLEALIACAGVAMNAARTVLDIPLTSAMVSAEGDVDLRGTLGVTEGVKVGFRDIRLRFDITSDAPQEKLDELLALTERYCVIYDTLRSSPRINVRMNTARS